MERLNSGTVELSCTQCAVGPMDPNTVSLSLMNLRTVTDCPEDTVFDNLYMFNLRMVLPQCGSRVGGKRPKRFFFRKFIKNFVKKKSTKNYFELKKFRKNMFV